MRAEQTNENKLVVAIQKFDTIKMKPGKTMTEFDERLHIVVIELIALGKEYTNREVSLKMMIAFFIDGEALGEVSPGVTIEEFRQMIIQGLFPSTDEGLAPVSLEEYQAPMTTVEHLAQDCTKEHQASEAVGGLQAQARTLKHQAPKQINPRGEQIASSSEPIKSIDFNEVAAIAAQAAAEHGEYQDSPNSRFEDTHEANQTLEIFF
ncbi:hypothetical protein F511_27121 [Dorcoceras hygrometricum]|uniref:Uncharacterized protein n=1 Tax=Dorcoceras hygrometricum TaxID=472368 RepID=A0A2Z7CHC9_9LAMI|nr:hypothetical protein F511_27121 [Dorcoceras hygrometricum]